MARDNYCNKATKTDQLARWLMEQGKSMTAKEAYEAGFRYDRGEETTAVTIGTVLNKLHENSRYSVERHYRQGKGARVTSVQVKSIMKRATPESAMGEAVTSMWRQLLGGQFGKMIQTQP